MTHDEALVELAALEYEGDWEMAHSDAAAVEVLRKALKGEAG